MSVRLLAVERWVPGAEEPPKVKRAAPAGRALAALARRVPGLEPARTGLYQALGPEKVQLTAPFFEQIAREGFDAAGTTAPLFHYTSYGPVLSVALDLGCRGPFASLEGQGDEAVLAVGQAVADLEAGRCRHALVVSFSHDGAAALVALEAGPGLRIVRGFGATEAQLQARLEQRAGVSLGARRLEGGVPELGALVAEAAGGQPTAALARAGEGRWSGLALVPRREPAVSAATVRDALLAAAAGGGAGLIDAETGATWTWPQVRLEALRLAAWLREHRVGTRVALVLPNSVAHAMLDVACAIDAVALCAFHPGTPPAELRARARALGCEVVVASPSLSEPLVEAGARVLTLAADPGANALPAPLEEGALRPAAPEVLFSLVQTSGTTGHSRACAISHGGALHSAQATARAFTRTRGTRYLTPLPLFHTNAQVVGLLTSLITQGALIIGPRLTAERLWAAVERTQAEGLSLVPAMVHDLVRLDRPAPGCLRYAVTSSAPLAPGLQRAFQRSTGVPLCSSYGLSEASGLVTFGYPGQPEGTVGKPVGCELSLSADREVLLRGPAVFLRYELDEEATARTLRDGWLHTGDMGQLDGDGNLTLLGRLKDLINRGGEKVAPLDVEAALLRHPAVREVCAFGVPDARLGEKVAVAVVFAQGQRASAEVLREACVDALADHMIPELWWEVAALPRGPTQKVLRRELQAHVGAHGRALEE